MRRMSEPHENYRETQRRLAQRQKTVEQQTHLHTLYGRGRILTVLAAAFPAWFAWHDHLFSAWWLLGPLSVFLVLLVRHDRLLRLLERSRRGVEVYAQGLRRMEDRWIGTGIRGERFVSAGHPYTGDLDIFGRGSLFELLCTARTQMGETCLATWLSAPADPATVLARQAAVVDLRERLDFREGLATAGDEVRSALQPQVLVDWGAKLSEPVARSVWFFAWGMVACNLGAAVYGVSGHGYYLLMLLVGLDWVLLWKQRTRIQSVLLDTDRPARQLELLAVLLDRVEQETFEAPLLQEMQAQLRAGDQPASQRIRRLQTLLSWIGLRQNLLFVLVDAVVLWTVQFAFAIENWRAENGARLAHWTRVLGEFEALIALATYAYEHPNDPFPEILAAGLSLHAEGVSHPLLPDRQAVRNTVKLDDTLAWCLYKNGRTQEAADMVQKALKYNTPEALFSFHAGMIYNKLGDRRTASLCLGRALSMNGSFHPIYVQVAADTLKQLGSQTGSASLAVSPPANR